MITGFLALAHNMSRANAAMKTTPNPACESGGWQGSLTQTTTITRSALLLPLAGDGNNV